MFTTSPRWEGLRTAKTHVAAALGVQAIEHHHKRVSGSPRLLLSGNQEFAPLMAADSARGQRITPLT